MKMGVVIAGCLLALQTTMATGQQPPADIAPLFSPPAEYRNELGSFRSPLQVSESSHVVTAEQWKHQRQEILKKWRSILGANAELIETPDVEVVSVSKRGDITQKQLRIELGLGGQKVDAFLLIPSGEGPFPAIVDVYYDAQTGAGMGTKLRDFAWQLAQRGFVTLAMGKPNTGVNLDDAAQIPGRGLPYFGPVDRRVEMQPIAALAYAAANAHLFLGNLPEVRSERIGIVGHSFGGKWAMFASCLYERFACAVWSDPGIVFDERDRRKENPGGSVNYWDAWYLGAELGFVAKEGMKYSWQPIPTRPEQRTGAYKTLIESGHDLVELHSLMAPRPLLVSGGTADPVERWAALNHAIGVNRVLGYENRVAMSNRATHSPTVESNEQIFRFFEWWLLRD